MNDNKARGDGALIAVSQSGSGIKRRFDLEFINRSVWIQIKRSNGFNLLIGNYIVTCQRIARQRLDKHPAIRARNNIMNVYSSLLGNSQRANELVG
jgi:hypothetical protein